MKFRVTKIAAAVATGLGVSVVGMNVAQADEILFPYIVSSATVTTILSVINEDRSVPTVIKKLHYHYYYKQDEGANKCLEVDYRNATSPNDVVTFDVGGNFGDSKGVLFEPTTDPNQVPSNQVNAKYDQNFAVFRNIKPVIAFGLIDNNAVISGHRISGEALVLEFKTGSAWGYKAYNHAKIYSLENNGTLFIRNLFDFSDRAETAGEVMVPFPTGGKNVDDFWVPIQILPLDTSVPNRVLTRFFVTPVSTFQANPGLTATIGLRVNDPGNAIFDVMYDRDENPISGQHDVPVTCVGRVDIVNNTAGYPGSPNNNLVTSAAQQFLLNGGWSNVAVTKGQATVIKLEFNPLSPSAVNGQPVSGSFNNAVWLRRGIREGTARADLAFNTDIPVLATYMIAGSTDTLDNNSPYPVLTAGVTVTSAGGLARQVTAGTSLPGQLGLGGVTALADIQAQLAALYVAAPFASQADVADAIDNNRISSAQ